LNNHDLEGIAQQHCHEQKSATPSSSQTRLRAASVEPLRVLLIDDEPLVLRANQRMLSFHHVDVAASGGEALCKLAESSDYDLVLCDLMMPGMDGAAVHDEIARRYPHLLERLVFCSGGAFSARTRTFIERAAFPLLEKPLTADSFGNVAQRVLALTRITGAGSRAPAIGRARPGRTA
jgi:CheY-like chemotaxis protein